MKGRKLLLVVILALLFGAMLAEDQEVQAKSKGKGKVTAKAGKAKASAKQKAGVRRKSNSNKWAVKRAAARRRSEAYHQRLVAKSRAVDNSLYNVAQNHIQDDDLAGEDIEVREAALQALGNHSGTIVVMEPKTGRILSIVNQKWAIGKPFKPCSTIKLVTSIAALSEGLADPDYPMEMSGGEELNMINALAYSNNEYFQQLGEQLGFEQVLTYCREVGFGEPTGINMDGESPGYVPSYKAPRTVPRMCSHGDDIGITAIQLAVLTSAIANGGYIYQPQILRTTKEKKDFKPILVRKVELDEANRLKIIEGMLAAVNYGTAKRSGAATLGVAGKTGSCNGDESKLGLFASFTNPSNPEMVVVVISTGSSERGALCSVVAGEIYNRLAHRFGKPAETVAPPPTPSERPRRVNPTTDSDNGGLQE